MTAPSTALPTSGAASAAFTHDADAREPVVAGERSPRAVKVLTFSQRFQLLRLGLQ